MILYIDPGTGSMLFTVLLGLIGAAVYSLRMLFIKLRFAISGGKVKADNKKIPIAIFADDKRYWTIFEPICRELNKRGVDVLYMTASPDDPGLDNPYEHVRGEYIGAGNKAFSKLNFLNATMRFGTKGRLHGFDSYVLQDENGEPLPVYSIASGLDYPGVGPEHAYLRDQGRVHYETVTDEEAMEAFFLLSRYEGIIPAIESAHALAYAIRYAKEHKTGSILVCLSGRGDKDIDYVYENYGCGEKFNLDQYKK